MAWHKREHTSTNVVVRSNAVVIESWFVVCTQKIPKNVQLKRPSRIARADHWTTVTQVTPHTVQVSIIVFIDWFLQSLINASRHIVPNHDIISKQNSCIQLLRYDELVKTLIITSCTSSIHNKLHQINVLRIMDIDHNKLHKFKSQINALWIIYSKLVISYCYICLDWKVVALQSKGHQWCESCLIQSNRIGSVLPGLGPLMSTTKEGHDCSTDLPCSLSTSRVLITGSAQRRKKACKNVKIVAVFGAVANIVECSICIHKSFLEKKRITKIENKESNRHLYSYCMSR